MVPLAVLLHPALVKMIPRGSRSPLKLAPRDMWVQPLAMAPLLVQCAVKPVEEPGVATLRYMSSMMMREEVVDREAAKARKASMDTEVCGQEQLQVAASSANRLVAEEAAWDDNALEPTVEDGQNEVLVARFDTNAVSMFVVEVGETEGASPAPPLRRGPTAQQRATLVCTSACCVRVEHHTHSCTVASVLLFALIDRLL